MCHGKQWNIQAISSLSRDPWKISIDDAIAQFPMNPNMYILMTLVWDYFLFPYITLSLVLTHQKDPSCRHVYKFTSHESLKLRPQDVYMPNAQGINLEMKQCRE